MYVLGRDDKSKRNMGEECKHFEELFLGLRLFRERTARISHSHWRECRPFCPMREKVEGNAVCQVRTDRACWSLNSCDYQRENEAER